jgi:signal transduction histidine kinase
MRLLSAVTAGALLIMILSALYILGSAANEPRYERALAALDTFVTTESRLRQDTLSARAGLLRNYDPINQEAADLHLVLGTLHDPKVESPALRLLEALVTRQDRLIERFKTDNALLQNSLAYFGFHEAEFPPSDGSRAFDLGVAALSTAVLRLILETTPETANGVTNALRRVASRPPLSDDPEARAGLVRHVELLRDLLLQMDSTTRSLYGQPFLQTENAVRSSIHALRQAARLSAMRYRLLLYVAAVFLLVLGIDLALQLRDHILALKRRVEFEHVMANISLSFVGAGMVGIERTVQLALAELAGRIGGDRAYYISSGNPPKIYRWGDDSCAWPVGWPALAQTLALKFQTKGGAISYVPSTDEIPEGWQKEQLRGAGVRGWVCISATCPGGDRMLGFDALDAPITWPRAELALLRMALDTIENAIGRAQLERDRQSLALSLQQVRRMHTIGALTSGVAHNFNNIIGAILGYTELQEAEIDRAKMATYSTGIRRAAERARDLVEQVLRFGRRQDASRNRVSLSTLMSETVSLLTASVRPDVVLQTATVPEGMVIHGDAAQLQQVIMNLCNNAAQAIDGAGKVSVGADTSTINAMLQLSHGNLAPGRYARIVISDTGRGMDKATLERLFEPFFTTKREGHGLGLATALEVVRGHSGAINVSSELSKGSVFEVWLPLDAREKGHGGSIESGLGRGETIMIISDDPLTLARDEEIVAALGYESVGFSEPEKALDAFRLSARHFDAVVITHWQPFSKALAISGAIDAAAPEVPILLATASDEAMTAALALVGIREVVSAPINSSELASALSRLLADNV